MKIFPEEQFLILNYLNDQIENQYISFEKIINDTNIDQIFVSSSLQTLEQMELVQLRKEKETELIVTEEGLEYKEHGLPSKILLNALSEFKEGLHIKELAERSNIEQSLVGKMLKILVGNEWVHKKGPLLSITSSGKKVIFEKQPEEKLLTLLCTKKRLIMEKAQEEYEFFNSGFEELKKFSNIFKTKNRKRKYARLTKEGKKIVSLGIKASIEITQITPEILKNKNWNDVNFKSYDINADTSFKKIGKIHPYQKIISKTRQIYLEMGFKEISSPYVESAFWTFDSLFQPQDHPAREMQDTFYIKQPGIANLPEKLIVDKVKETHENGGETGSTGWKYKWNLDIAKKMVLRTHTTAASIKYIKEHRGEPLKVFCLGYVFRRETVDYKHLPVFTQVDGIVVDKNVSLSNLIYLLQEFYKKMGFNKIEVRPAFFPYTEPSLEIFVYMEEKKDWIEMGGAGIFRKEVTLPMGCDMPVLAWGLGLERLAMFKYNLNDIRNLYVANLKWLKGVSLCQ